MKGKIFTEVELLWQVENGMKQDSIGVIGWHNSFYKKVIVLSLLFIAVVTEGLAFHRIPTVYITTKGGEVIDLRDRWTDSVGLRIVMPDSVVAYATSYAEVKLRGHSTFTKPKKPFALKLDRKNNLLGMGSHKRWVLLANFMDHSNMRNSLALAVARATGLDWTSDCRFVDVAVNGVYQGLYLLCEQVEVTPGRVCVDAKDGWLIEGDSYDDGEYRFRTTLKGLPFEMKYPKHPSSRQMQAIKKELDSLETTFYSGNGLSELFARMIDVDSYVDWWIIHELTQNAEPNGPRSCYIHKGADGKMRMGPVWDFDLSFIDVGLDSGGDIRPSRFTLEGVRRLTVDSLYNTHALWYDRLLNDSAFVSRLQERWHFLKPRFVALSEDIDRWKEQISPSAKADEELWCGQDPARFDIHTSFLDSVDNLKRTFLHRIDVLDRLMTDGSLFPCPYK